MARYPTTSGLVFLTILSVLTFSGCGDSSDPVAAAPTTIGPDGGSVSGGRGASVTIPAGALVEETVIKVSSTIDAGDLPFPVAPVSSFDGAARFEPHGLEFDKPVAISIPLDHAMTPGTELELFVFDESIPGWTSDTQAVVAGDGGFATAEVTHFSYYILMGDSQFWFGIFRRDFFDICNPTPSDQLFQSTVDLLDQAFATGNRSLHDYSSHYPSLQYGCYEIVGVSYVLALVRAVPDETQEGNWIPIEEKVFEREAPPGLVELSFLDQQDRRISDSTCGEYQLSYTWDMVVRLDCTAPALDVEAENGNLAAGETTEVRATLTCGDESFSGQNVFFALDPATVFGEVGPELSVTDKNGVARAVFNPGDCLPAGQAESATILAGYEACASQNMSQVVESAASVLATGSLTGNWQVVMQSTSSDCDPPDSIEPPWTAHIVQNGNTFSVGSSTGHINGNQVSWGATYQEDAGWTTESCGGTLSEDGTEMRVTCTWSYEDSEDPELNCSGSDFTIATKICR